MINQSKIKQKENTSKREFYLLLHTLWKNKQPITSLVQT